MKNISSLLKRKWCDEISRCPQCHHETASGWVSMRKWGKERRKWWAGGPCANRHYTSRPWVPTWLKVTRNQQTTSKRWPSCSLLSLISQICETWRVCQGKAKAYLEKHGRKQIVVPTRTEPKAWQWRQRGGYWGRTAGGLGLNMESKGLGIGEGGTVARLVTCKGPPCNSWWISQQKFFRPRAVRMIHLEGQRKRTVPQERHICKTVCWNEDRIKTFPGKQKPRESIITKPALQESPSGWGEWQVII